MHHHRFRTIFIATIVLLMATLVGGATFVLNRTWSSVLAAANATLDRTARAAEGIVNSQLVQVDSALASLPDVFAAAGRNQGGPMPQADAGRLLRSLETQSFAYRDLLLLRPTGEVWSAARTTSRTRPFAIAPDQLASRRSPGVSTIFGPLQNPVTAEWALYIVRPVQLPGLGDMLAAAEVPISSLIAPLSSIGDVPGLRISIERPDGVLVASHPHDETGIGRAQLPAEKAGTLSGLPGSGSAPLIETSRPLLYRELKLVTSLDPTLATTDWARDRDRLLGLILICAIFLIVLVGAVLLGQQQRDRAQTLLEDAIDSMSDGFVMWDADERLVTCNDKYRDLYAKSAPFIKPGARFEHIIRKGVEVGQYPQATGDVEGFVRGIVEWHREGKGSFERLLPDGRWILVTERKTASGGRVGTRTDITERKRQEELLLQYSRELEQLAVRFETTVKAAAAQVESSAGAASVEADMMARAASEAVAQARFVTTAAEGTSRSVMSVAASSEQLLSSINNIAQRVETAARMADQAADCTRMASGVMSGLDQAASRITAVVDLIGSIASQTNLLALNATIEAARAGEAGRGFSVVAAEVKALAAQTTRSLDSIGQQVRAIQQSSHEAMGSIASIDAIVAELKATAASIEQSIAEQSIAASDIAASTHDTASGTADVFRAVMMITERSEQISGSTEGLRITAQKLLAEAQSLRSGSETFLASVRAGRAA